MDDNYINSYASRENIEWSNFWYDQADAPYQKRMLMIGDSTSRVIRRMLSEMMNCPIDLFATSAAFRDIIFWNQLDCFFKDSIYSKYDYITIWLGNHSRINEMGNGPFEQHDYDRLAIDFKKLLEYVAKYRAKALVMPSLYIFEPWKQKYPKEATIRKKLNIWPPEVLNEEESLIVRRKNTIMEKVAKENGFAFFNIAECMMSTKYRHTDHIHYESAANPLMCQIIKEQLEKL